MDTLADYALLMDFIPLDDKRYRSGRATEQGCESRNMTLRADRVRWSPSEPMPGGSGLEQQVLGRRKREWASLRHQQLKSKRCPPGGLSMTGGGSVSPPSPGLDVARSRAGIAPSSPSAPAGTPSTVLPGWWRARPTLPRPAECTSTLTRQPRVPSGCGRLCPLTNSS